MSFKLIFRRKIKDRFLFLLVSIFIFTFCIPTFTVDGALKPSAAFLKTEISILASNVNTDFIYNITDGNARITGYIGRGGVVTIPGTLGNAPVTSIGNYAFQGNIGVTGISIPDSVTSIGSSAFSGCSNLEAIVIPQGVTSIGSWAFDRCTAMTSIRFNSATTAIYGSSNVLPTTTKIIGYNISTARKYASKYNREFEAIDAANTLRSIAITSPAAKIVYTAGEALSIEGLVVTGTYSDNSTSVEDITEANITGFNSSAPAINQVLTITLGGKTTTYNVQILASNVNTDFIYSIEGGNARITGYIGRGGVVTIPATLGNAPVTSIGNYAFQGNIGITSIIIPDSVTSIGDSSFSWCSGLTTISIPASVSSIGSWAFDGCRALSSIRFNSASTIIYDSANVLPAVTKIIGYDTSTAKAYATKYNLEFEAIP